MDDVLAQRVKDVANRPRVEDPLEERIRLDIERQRQLAALKDQPKPEPEPEPEAEPEPEPVLVSKRTRSASDPRAGYTVKRNGPWYQLYRADGVQQGKSKRSEGEAWAILDRIVNNEATEDDLQVGD